MDETLLTLMSILGPLLLLVVLAYVIVRNRRRPGEPDEAVTEKATHDLYDEEEERHRKGLDGR